MKQKTENSKMKVETTAYLVLEDGTVYEGESLGASGKAIGQMIFDTGVTGFQEKLTDPKFTKKILLQTFPLIGNYGFNDEDYTSNEIHPSAYVVREWCQEPSNFRSKYTLDEFLKNHNTVGICNIDTRSLTKKIRGNQQVKGAVVSQLPDSLDELITEIKNFEGEV